MTASSSSPAAASQTSTNARTSPLRPALVASGVRDVIAYLLLPLLGPALHLGATAGPLVTGLVVLGAVLSARAMVRGLRQHRDGLTMFAAALLSLNLLSLGSLL
jgi:hypothetical protein